jgi:hypothetical protein
MVTAHITRHATRWGSGGQLAAPEAGLLGVSAEGFRHLLRLQQRAFYTLVGFVPTAADRRRPAVCTDVNTADNSLRPRYALPKPIRTASERRSAGIRIGKSNSGACISKLGWINRPAHSVALPLTHWASAVSPLLAIGRIARDMDGARSGTACGSATVVPESGLRTDPTGFLLV